MSLSPHYPRPSLVKRAERIAPGPESPPAVRGGQASLRSYTTPLGAAARELTPAYLRYIELHGHAVHHPKGGCSISTRRSGRSETQTFGFWSAKAAEDFEWFWERYRLVYGHGDHGGQVAA